MNKVYLIILLAALIAVQAQSAAPINFYVATDGSDSWSGKLAAPNAKHSDGPFATIERARDAVRELRGKKGGLKSSAIVNIRGGTYYLVSPILFDPHDSGTLSCPIIYKAYKDEKPVISGGRPISGWREEEVNGKKMWTADLPEVREGRSWFRQLFVNNERRPRPRLPKEGFYQIAELLPDDAKAPWNMGHQVFKFAEGDIKAWKNLEDVEAVVLHLWVDSRLRINGIDEKNRIVGFSQPSIYRMTVNHSDTPAPYYIENVFEALEVPGEWYLDRRAGKLYYLPKPGERMENCTFVAPHLAQVLRVESDGKSPVQYLEFRGILFAHTEWNLPYDSSGVRQAAVNVPGAIYMQGTEFCKIYDCEIAHISNYAIEVDTGCKGSTIARNSIFDIGAGGIKVGRGSSLTTISDNEIGDGGKIHHGAVGILIGDSPRNRILHNHIHHLYYTGIQVGWTWGYNRSNAVGNEIAYNHIHDLGQGWLSDFGGIYTVGVSFGTVIRRNLIHDCYSRTYGGWGIYLDEGSSLIRVANNIVYRTKSGGFDIHYGCNNLVENNIFALAKESQISLGDPEPHVQFRFMRNIVYYNEGWLLAGDRLPNPDSFDYNLYYTDGTGAGFTKEHFNAWQANRLDLHGLVADPKFVDPTNNNFGLQPDSPALALGFRPIDLSNVGPRR